MGEKTALLLPFGHILSHVARLLLIAKELQAMGYRVIFAGEGRPLDFARQEGYEVRPLIEYPLQELLEAAQQRALLGLYTAESLEKYVQADLAIMREIGPDVVVSDWRNSVGISAELVGLPYARITNAYTTNYATIPMPVLPPVLPEFIASLLGRMADAILTKILAKGFNDVRHEYGLPLRGDFKDITAGWDLTLMCDIPEYAPTRDLPGTFHYIGPLVWEPKGPLPEWMDELAPNRPVIYFTMGTTGHAQLFKEVADCLGDTEYQVIVTTGFHEPAEFREAAPDNFHVENFLPGSEVLKRSDLIVYHGGSSTTYQALAGGVPFIAIPTHPDQRWNANRLVVMGVGLKLEGKQVSHLREAVEKVLGDPGYREIAGRWKILMANYNGPKTAARLIDQHITRA